jgi:hypothetical protein
MLLTWESTESCALWGTRKVVSPAAYGGRPRAKPCCAVPWRSMVPNVFCYLLAILNSGEYRLRYAEPLRDDFARVPVTSSPEVFWAMVGRGVEICELQTSFNSRESDSIFPAQGSNEITKRQFPVDAEGRLWINDDQHFAGIDEALDSYSVGGIRVLSQWLSDRRGRVLSTDDVDAFRGLISTITRLIDIPSEIDEIIENHGGWHL